MCPRSARAATATWRSRRTVRRSRWHCTATRAWRTTRTSTCMSCAPTAPGCTRSPRAAEPTIRPATLPTDTGSRISRWSAPGSRPVAGGWWWWGGRGGGVVGGPGGRAEGRTVEATAGWTLSVGSYAWCPDSNCIYAVVEERGRENVYRIDVPSWQRSLVIGSAGVNTSVSIAPDGKTLAYLHQTATHPAELWVGGRQLSHHSDAAVAGLALAALEPFGFRGALGDSVYGWILKPPGFVASKKYPLVYLLHGGPQTAWLDVWHARWNYQMFAARGYVVVAVNRHGSTGYGQKFADAVSQHWGDYPYEDLMKGLDIAARLPYVDSTRMAAAGASYGGYMVYWMAGHTNRFKAFVAHDGVFNPASMAGSTEELWFVDWEFGGPPYASRAPHEKRSPLNVARNWKTPILIVHSQLDYRVDLSEGYQAFTAAKVLGVPAKFLYFPDEGHWVLKPRNRRLWWSTVLDWLDQYLRPQALTGVR